MSNSLRDQLVKAGLASKQSANQLEAKSRKQHKKPRKKSTSDKAAEAAAKAKKERDRELNAELEEKKRRAEIKGQIKVLIDDHGVKEYQGETVFNYESNGKIRQLFVTEAVHAGLSKDKLAVTRFNGKTFLVPTETAERILGLNPEWSVARPGAEKSTSAEDDEYANYQVPDDLTW
ncbi:MAG: DUF2058 domain-containing protein [Pseudomonadota bacterium]